MRRYREGVELPYHLIAIMYGPYSAVFIGAVVSLKSRDSRVRLSEYSEYQSANLPIRQAAKRLYSSYPMFINRYAFT